MAHPQTPPTFSPVTTGSDEYSIELNDANLTTKAWRSSRYDGSKTETAVLNKYSEGDISVGKTTAVQKYSRNIYLGNGVIGMDNNGSEDPLLAKFPNFSYITTLKYITVNGDNTISTDIVESKPDDFNSRRGFYRSFYEDFPEKSSCKIIINDVSTKTNLKDSYEIYFNGGQLEKLIKFNFPNSSAGYYLTNLSTSYNITQTGTKFSSNVLFLNTNELRNFYTGSLRAIDGDVENLTLSELNNYIEPFFSSYKNLSQYIGDKRMFLSFCTQSGIPSSPSNGDEFTPLRTNATGSIPEGEIYRTKNLAELSTIEVMDINYNNAILNGQLIFTKTPLFDTNQIYVAGGTSVGDNAGVPTPSSFAGGSIILSQTEDATPSLLINLPKNEHLPDGIGGKGFVIIPDNLHPHVKKNLTHFLAKAGVSLDLDTIPALDTTFERLS